MITQEQFCAGPIDICPNCGGANVEHGSLFHRFGTVACDMKCLECNATWTQEYGKIAYFNLDMPETHEGMEDVEDDGTNDLPGQDDNGGEDIAVCPVCGGSGEGDHKDTKCPRCNGTGVIHPEEELSGGQ